MTQAVSEPYQNYKVVLLVWSSLLLVLGVLSLFQSETYQHYTGIAKASLQISYSVCLIYFCLVSTAVVRLKRVLYFGVAFVVVRFLLDLHNIHDNFGLTFINVGTTLLASGIFSAPYIWAISRLKQSPRQKKGT